MVCQGSAVASVMGGRERTAMNDYVIKAGEMVSPETEAMYRILTECDQDFYPPLSARSSSRQLSWDTKEEKNDGVKDYYEMLLEQENLFWKEDGEIAGFLSFLPHYSCEYLKDYGDICYLTTLCISPKFRGRGLSPKIYAAVFAHIHRTYPEQTIAFRTWSTNAAQMHLVKRLGLTEVLRLPDDRGPGVDTIYYVLIES